MALYFKDIEITNIDNLVPQTGLDITDIWFGETNVYTVWQVYEGTLPAMINANGSDMKQYQIWGNVGGVGDRTVNILSVHDFIANAEFDVANPNRRLKYVEFQGEPNAWYTISTNFYGLQTASWYVAKPNETPSTDNNGCYSGRPTLSKQADHDGKIWVWGRFVTTDDAKPITEMRASDYVMLVKDTTAPASFVPFGYEVDMGSIDDAKIPELSTIVQGGWSASAGTIPVPAQPAQSNRCRSTKFYPINGTKLIYNCGNIATNIVWITASGVSLGGSGFLTGAGIIDVEEQAKKVTFIFAAANATSKITPSDVIEESPTVSPDITTPIYIGDEPLEKDEYVDYQAGKIYRIINGVLTPTDPPVPLPALPTCEGTTVIEYAGQSVAPEKVLLKYRKEGF